MPGRPRKPLTLHVLQGTAQKCRMEKRKNELQLPPEVPDAPEWMSGEAKLEWGRITGHPMYAAILSKVDRAMLATFCTMWGRFVEAEKAGAPVKTAHVLAMNSLASKLGLSPVDRTKIHLEPEEKPRNRFAAFGKR
jgi:phage terminase small subunit